MICGKCGNEIKDGSTSCPECGTSFVVEPPVVNNISDTGSSKNKWWCNFLIKFIYFIITIEIIAAEIGGIALIVDGSDHSYGMDEVTIGLGIALMLIGPAFAILSNAMVMILANMAKDVSLIRDMLSK